MSSRIAQGPDFYRDLAELPEGLVGELIGGRLYTQPRPSGPHAVASSGLGADLYRAYQRGRGGPGGWWILDEPELHFVRDTEVLVPDIAGWRRERMPHVPPDQRFEVIPDWVCEVLSPSTAKKDRIEKMPAYARVGVAFLWLVDPIARTLETYSLNGGQWLVVGQFKDQDLVASHPFVELRLELGLLWTDASVPDDQKV